MVRIEAAGRALDIEFDFVGRAGPPGEPLPWLVFLHEGLGSLSMWRDFPEQLCQACGWRGLVYSRPGYGRSSPRPHSERWGPDFMHIQAQQVLPALLQALGAPPRVALFGHSDGGSIALIHAASRPQAVSHTIVLAPHILVEDLSVTSIAATRRAYLEGGPASELRRKLARHHADVDSAFWGWNNIWLDPAFRDWSLSSLLTRLGGPLLAIQGEDDEYGTMAQIDGIAHAMTPARCRLLKLAACGHSPHRDQPQAVIDACRALLAP